MTTRSNLFFLASFLFLLPLSAKAGLGTTDGSERQRFGEDRYSVIVARVQKVWIAKSTDPDDDRDHNMVTLAPLVTIAGTFDPSANPSATFQFFADTDSSSIAAPPKKGEIIMAVIRDHILIHEDPNPHNVIVSDICTFMPGSTALVVLKGLDDPAVLQTLERLQKARAIGKKREELEKTFGEKKP